MSRKTRKPKNKLLVPFEWIGIGVGLCTIPWLPRKALFTFCDVLSAFMYFFDRRGKRRALENLRIVCGCSRHTAEPWAFDPDRARYDATDRERRIIRRAYRNMARSVGYAFWTIRAARRRGAETTQRCAHDLERIIRRHPSCWVMNCNFFSKRPRPEDAKTPKEREAKRG